MNQPGRWSHGLIGVFLIVGSGFANVSVAASPAKPPARQPEKIEITPAIVAAGKSSNQFAFDIYSQLRSQQGNLFFSPASIATALTMVHAGARGATADEMSQVLHLASDDSRQAEGFGGLSRLLNRESKNYRLSMANRLWGQKSYPFLPDFLAVTRDHFGAELQSLDFGQPEPARQEINRWAAEHTGGKIPQLIGPGVLNAMTRLVLTNAIYFKGGWEHEFAKSATKNEPFHLSARKDVQTPLMRQSEEFAYMETSDLQMVALPYGGHDLSMLVLLPKRTEGLAALEEQLTAENLSAWSAKLDSRRVNLFLPKFKTTSQFELSKTLGSLGMTLAFRDAADLSGISSAEGLKISDVIHKAYVDVTEEGTEAAAATAITIAPTAAPIGKPQRPVVFRADHPFVFLIRDNRAGAVLFLGRVSDPSQAGQ